MKEWKEPISLVVSIWIVDGQHAAFEQFEEKAAAMMAKHGGELVHATRITRKNSAGDADEIHVLTFPDLAAFDAYRKSPAYVAMAHERQACIAKTEILFGIPASYPTDKGL